MKFITKNFVPEDADGWAEYALVTVSEDTRKEVLEARELYQMTKAKNGSLYALEFWDANAEYFACSEEDTFTEEEQKALEEHGYVRVADTVTLLSLPFVEESRTDCDVLVVHDDGFFWRGSHKYTAMQAETKLLPFDVLLHSP